MLNKLVVIKGAGDIASGVAHRLTRCGFGVVMTEIAQPTVVRRSVSYAQAVYDQVVEVEGVVARLVLTPEQAMEVAAAHQIALLVDPQAEVIDKLQPLVVVDAILAKYNTGTRRELAPIVIGLGPGFTAGEDVHAVIETNRGHDLGRMILQGQAAPNTGIPGDVTGYTIERVLRAPAAGLFYARKVLGDLVKAGEVVGWIQAPEQGSTQRIEVRSALDGLIRGLLMDGLQVCQGFKLGDIDPRGNQVDYRTISEKARAIGGGVVEAILYFSGLIG